MFSWNVREWPYYRFMSVMVTLKPSLVFQFPSYVSVELILNQVVEKKYPVTSIKKRTTPEQKSANCSVLLIAVLQHSERSCTVKARAFASCFICSHSLFLLWLSSMNREWWKKHRNSNFTVTTMLIYSYIWLAANCDWLTESWMSYNRTVSLLLQNVLSYVL
jgi:hypothetical protein